jgi:hypothetical protein
MKKLGPIFARMDVDTGLRVSQLADDAGDQRHLEAVQLVRDAMLKGRPQAGITKQRFVHAGQRRVAVERGLHIGVEHAADRG